MDDLLPGLILVVFFTSTLSGIIGMAGGMVLMGALLWHLEPLEAIFVHGVIQGLANFQRFYQLRSHVKLRIFFYYSLGAVLAFILLRESSFRPSRLSIYLLMSLSAVLSALQLKPPFDVESKQVVFLGGFLSNAMQVIGGVAGPMLDLLFQNRHFNRYEIVGTKSLCVVGGHFLKVVFVTELLGIQRAQLLVNQNLVFYLFASFLGTGLSKLILQKISDHNFFRLCSVFLVILSLFYLWKAIGPWFYL